MDISALIILIVFLIIIIYLVLIKVWNKYFKIPPKRVHCWKCGEDFEIERLELKPNSLTMTIRQIYCPNCGQYIQTDSSDSPW